MTDRECWIFGCTTEEWEALDQWGKITALFQHITQLDRKLEAKRQKIKRLTDRGIEDMKYEIERKNTEIDRLQKVVMNRNKRIEELEEAAAKKKFHSGKQIFKYYNVPDDEIERLLALETKYQAKIDRLRADGEAIGAHFQTLLKSKQQADKRIEELEAKTAAFKKWLFRECFRSGEGGGQSDE